ncbi:MFS transporter [Acidibrevibacterium fodinaquatile]|uniref:MFS transporter n=1 Tax=Acidibrevibacterium fodinaquatile TaxID=1969806 RepID=UPI000E0E071D|nr:MFS transporter [Acidibrevibacterium fodinaquatile]
MNHYGEGALGHPGCRRRATTRLLVLVGMCLAVLIAQIDSSVVNLATHAIGDSFQAGVAPLQWVLDAYNLVYAVLLLSGGLVADLYGRRRTFAVGTIVMAAGSLICAFSPGVGVLIGGRAITGIAAALLVPSSLAIIRVVWPEPAARGRVLGVWASCNGLAFAIGPTLGGILIEHFGWRSVFLLAVPLAFAAFALAEMAVPESADPNGRHFDLPGQVFGALTLGGVALAAIAVHGGGRLWVVALGVAAIALPLFLRIERRRAQAALVPLDMFRIPAFGGGVITTAAMTFGIYGMTFLTPLLWQSEDHLTPSDAGIALLSVSLAFFLVSTQSGRLAERIGARLMIAIGTGLIGCGSLVLAITDAGMPMVLAQIGLTMAGVGMGLNTGPLYGIAVGSVGPERAGTASALINVARMVGATLGVALLGSVFALLHGGPAGFCAAMLVAGAVQLGGALVAFATVK